MKKLQKNKKGFTFIELLVTVTIILVIATGMFVNFSSANKKARDNRRRTDLEKIRTALELFRQENGRYPRYPNQPVTSQPSEGLEGRYLDTWPTDPSRLTDYQYCRDSLYTYRIVGCLEVDSGVAASGVSCGSADGWQPAGTVCAAGVGGTNALVLSNP